jgi:hypothetical protein
MQNKSHVGIQVKYLLLLMDFNKNLNAFTNFSKSSLLSVVRHAHTIYSVIYQWTCQWTYHISHFIWYTVLLKKSPQNQPAS